jgi:hypothetical protein
MVTRRGGGIKHGRPSARLSCAIYERRFSSSVDAHRLRKSLAGCAVDFTIRQDISAPCCLLARTPSPDEFGCLKLPEKLLLAAPLVPVTLSLTLAASP